jgi:hypothetical protein
VNDSGYSAALLATQVGQGWSALLVILAIFGWSALMLLLVLAIARSWPPRSNDTHPRRRLSGGR